MKKLFFASLATVLLLSCSRDDDSSSVVGVWKITKFIILDGKTKNLISTELNSACEAKCTYEFKSDKTFLITLFLPNNNGVCISDGTLTGTYDYNPTTKIFSMSDSSGTDNGEVYKLTNSEMQIISSFDEDYNDDGTSDMEITVFNK